MSNDGSRVVMGTVCIGSALPAFKIVRCDAVEGARSREECSDVATVVIPRRGVFVWETGGERVVADANTVLLFEPQQPHRIAHPADGGDECFSLQVRDESLLERLGADGRPLHWILDGPSQRTLHALAYALSVSRDPMETEELALAILSSLAPKAKPRPDRYARAIDGVRERIACTPSEATTLAQLAAGSGLSSFELARRFRARTGSSIHQYRLRVRLLQARARLAAGQVDLTELALELGFASHAHFTATFKRAFGIPPSRTRDRAYRSGYSARC